MIRTAKPASLSTLDPNDPLAAIMRPPSTETPQERQARLAREAEAKRISDRIDEQINMDRERYKKSKEDVKLLLLGQAESGKSTLQKQFQLLYNPSSLEEERLSWRTVIYYNIARPVRRILEALDAFNELSDEEMDDSVSMDIDSKLGTPDTATRLTSPSPGFTNNPVDYTTSSVGAPSIKSGYEAQLDDLRNRLAPLLGAEASLAERLSGGIAVSGSGRGSVYVRSGWQARSVLGKSTKSRAPSGRFSLSGQRSSLERTPPRAEGEPDSLIEEVASIVAACKDDVHELWDHPAVQRLRDKRKLRLEEWAEFFLDNIDRVSASGYVPTMDDILHARIQTMGVAEHIFDMSVHGRQVTWHLYDVGGARGQRHTWIPYFDDANAIIFLAPVSAYDQYLEEDPRTNRIDDSLQLFTEICSNALLKKVHLVLFLNKTDVLRNKLQRGIKVKKYITSYGDRPMEFEAVVNYFKAHFTQVHKRNNETKRVLYTHLTSVVDTKTTKSIITNVSDSIFRKYLADAALV
ncbi:G-protein alpha subunit [Panus rudis PR-1116 ss-1]|nr:G-protein alpha subunit [Panus rudis PR-1116 ss-1]